MKRGTRYIISGLLFFAFSVLPLASSVTCDGCKDLVEIPTHLKGVHYLTWWNNLLFEAGAISNQPTYCFPEIDELHFEGRNNTTIVLRHFVAFTNSRERHFFEIRKIEQND